MTSPSFTPQQITEFEKNIRFMERLIGVYTWPSCSEIRAYLTIYGKMKASDLSKLLDLQGEKSIYKSLNRLIEAKLVEKEYEPGSRRNAFYYMTTHTTNDPDFTSDFIAYLIEHNRYELITEYLTAANRGSISFIQVMTSIMEGRIISSKNPTLGSEYIESTTFIETILSVPNPEPLLKKFNDLIRQEFPKYIDKKADFKKGIPHPAAFFLAIVPLGNK